MYLFKLLIMRLFKFTLALLLLMCVSCNMFASDPKGKKEEASKATQAKVVSLTTAEFKEKVFNFDNYATNGKKWEYAGSLPAIVDFYADWCGPCRMLSPILSELAEEYAGKIVIYKVDIDRHRDVATFFSATSIPMLLFIPAKGDPQMSRGLLPKDTIREAIDSFLLGGGE